MQMRRQIVVGEFFFISLGQIRVKGKGEGVMGAWSILREGRKHE